MNHGPGAIAPPDAEVIEVRVTPSGSGRGGAAWFRARYGRRGIVFRLYANIPPG